MFISLKPLAQRKITADQVIARLRPKLARVPGALIILQAAQDMRVGGRMSAAHYQFTMRGDNVEDLLAVRAPHVPGVAQNSHHRRREQRPAEPRPAVLGAIDRATAARFGISPQLIDATLYDAFGQRQVSTMYTAAEPVSRGDGSRSGILAESGDRCAMFTCARPAATMVPLNAFAHFGPQLAPLSVNHQGLFPAVTISFNLQPGVALGDAVDAITQAASKVGLPPTIQTMFAGTAQAYQDRWATKAS